MKRTCNYGRPVAESRRRSVQNDYYLKRLHDHGFFSAHSVGWTEFLQYELFDNLSAIFSERRCDESFSVLDAGSGLGDFAGQIRSMGFNSVRYTGIDIMPEMVEASRNKYTQDRFITGDFMKISFIELFDYAVCSGALNIITERTYDRHFDYVIQFAHKLYTITRHACAFNLLSESGRDYFHDKNDGFFYTDARRVRESCEKFSSNAVVTIREHAYTFTVHIFKGHD